MVSPVLSEEGRRALDIILRTKSPLARPGLEAKVLRVVSLLMHESGLEAAGQGTVLAAADLVLGAVSAAVYWKVRDPDGYRRRFLEPYYDRRAYDAGPYEVVRWKSLPHRPAKRPGQMRVVAFSASPRRGANTEVLMDEALRGARDAGATVERVRLQEMNLGYCVNCRKCKEPGFEPICSIRDDILPIYESLRDSDAMILAFPVFRSRECAQVATFIDRLHCLVRPKTGVSSGADLMREREGERFQREAVAFAPIFEPGRKALVIGVWGTAHPDTYESVMERVMTTLSGSNIEPVEALSASGFVGMLHGLDEDGKGMIRHFPKQLRKAYDAGRALVLGAE